MSNKLRTVKSGGQGAGLEITGQIIEYLLAATAAAVCVAVPLYARDGYDQIGNAKFEIYKNLLCMGFTPLLILAAVYGVFWIREKAKYRWSVTDVFVLAYLFLTILASVFGGFYRDALWGSFGWNMGLLSQLSFVLLYLFFSRFGKYYRSVLMIMCTVSAIVFVIGILHRAGIDPIGFYQGLSDDQMAQFLSTVGQATWYASYLIVVLPVGIAVFLYAQSKVWRMVSGIYLAAGFSSLVTQNSDSAYFALAGFMLVFFWGCVEKRESMRRFMAVCVLFFASGKVMYFVMQMNPNPELIYDFFTRLVLCSRLTGVLLVICLVLYVVLWRQKDKVYPLQVMLWVRRVVLISTGVLLVGIVVLIILQTKELLPAGIAQKLSAVSYFNWKAEWGNGRGRIWHFVVEIFMQEDLLHKLIGVGPDCMSSYVAAYYSEEAEMLWGQKMLTNAHNEWLNMFISGGILGAVTYVGIFVTAVRRFMKAAHADILLTGIAAALVSYMAYNFFCYQQVCCTPFVFLLMGIGEYLCRRHSCQMNVK